MPPFDPKMLQMLQSAAAGAGAPAGSMMPPGPPAAGGASGPGGVPVPGMDATARLALSALDQLAPREASGELGKDRVSNALALAQKLIQTALPHVQQWDAKTAKDLHVIGRQIADARINLEKEEEPGPPPEALISGIGSTGIPGGF